MLRYADSYTKSIKIEGQVKQTYDLDKKVTFLLKQQD